MCVFISRLNDGMGHRGLDWTEFKHSSHMSNSVSATALGCVDALCSARI